MIHIFNQFLLAERTGNWSLHLRNAAAMLSYLAAFLCIKSPFYLQKMGKLPQEHPEVYDKFKNGFHVIRCSDRFRAGLSTDLFIELVLMHSVKSQGGLTLDVKWMKIRD